MSSGTWCFVTVLKLSVKAHIKSVREVRDCLFRTFRSTPHCCDWLKFLGADMKINNA